MIKNIKKILSAITIAATMTSMLVGCGSSSNSASSDGGSSNGNVTLTYGLWDKNQEPGMRAIADVFEAKNPNIKINVEVTPWDQYWTKLDAAATGGSLPDVFWMHSNEIARYSSNGMLLDLTNRIKESKLVDLSKFPSDLVKLYENDGKNYAIPKDFDTIGLWYNKTLFDEAGIAYPDATWTWDKLLEVSKKLTNPEKGIYGIGAPLSTQEGFDNFIYQNGGKVISDDKTKSGYDTKEVKDAMQWYVDLSLKEKVSPTQSQFSENGSAVFFESGKTAMGIYGSWMTSEFASNEYTAKNCNVAVLPQGKKKASIYNGLGNAVSANTSHKEEALKFVEFLGSEEAQKIQSEKGAAISAYKGSADAWVKSIPTFNLKAYVDMLDYGVIRPYSKETVKWENVELETLVKAFSGETSVSNTCDEVAKQVNAILATEK